jgi:aryl-alcohol dehydrogenase-like predicted oxidoreductase
VDCQIVAAIERALVSGVNVIDTSINYRDGRSERSVGAAVRRAIGRDNVQRDEIFVASKGGYLPLSRGTPRDQAERYLRSIDCGAAIDEVVDGCHCLSPAVLASQLARSLAGLQLDTLDLYYVHNPEVQLREIDRAQFADRMRRAFVLLEAACASGAIRRYGVTTWHGLLVAPDHPLHLDLAQLRALARDAAGGDDHLDFVQLPLNPLLPNALVATQRLLGREVPLLLAAEELGLGVIASSAVAGGQRIAGGGALAVLLERLGTPGDSDAQRSLQLARSIPQIASCLVGMRRPEHVAEVLAVAARPPVRLEELALASSELQT